MLLPLLFLLQVKLAEQADIATDATARAEQLEEDLVGLRAEVAQVTVTIALSQHSKARNSPCLGKLPSRWCLPSRELAERTKQVITLSCYVVGLQMRRTAAIRGNSSSPLAQLSADMAEREQALAEKLASAEARAASAAAEREAIKQRVLQLETELRQKDRAVEEALQAAAAGGGKDKQVRLLLAVQLLLWLNHGIEKTKVMTSTNFTCSQVALCRAVAGPWRLRLVRFSCTCTTQLVILQGHCMQYSLCLSSCLNCCCLVPAGGHPDGSCVVARSPKQPTSCSSSQA